MNGLAPAGILGGALGSLVASPVKAAANATLSVVNGWIVDGAEAMLREVISVISLVTTPSLTQSWFSVHYWQVAALAMLLTVPFLFAAAVQAILRSDLNLLLRAALFDLPIAAVAVYAAAPLITLMLAATDEMCALVSGGGPVGGTFLAGLPLDLSKAGSGFLIVVIAVVILIAGLVLLVELIVRSAAIYVVVLFLPLGFAAMVWPARRIWIKRMLETLIALILAKFAMVAILTLAVAALASLTQHPTALTTALTAMALIVIATASPWALLRLLPFTEVAASAVLAMHQDSGRAIDRRARQIGNEGAGAVADVVVGGTGMLREYAARAASDSGGGRGARGAVMAVLGAGTSTGGGDEASGGGGRDGGRGGSDGGGGRDGGDAGSGGAAPPPPPPGLDPPFEGPHRLSPGDSGSAVTPPGRAVPVPQADPAGPDQVFSASPPAAPAPGARPLALRAPGHAGGGQVRPAPGSDLARIFDPAEVPLEADDSYLRGPELLDLNSPHPGLLTPPDSEQPQ